METALLSSSNCFAPKNWAIMMPAPLPKPMEKARNRKASVPEVPVAARAFWETKFPTTMPSTVL